MQVFCKYLTQALCKDTHRSVSIFHKPFVSILHKPSVRTLTQVIEDFLVMSYFSLNSLFSDTGTKIE